MQVHDACSNVQISANWLPTLYRLLPMIYDSNQLHKKWCYKFHRNSGGGGRGGGCDLSSRCLLKQVSSNLDWLNIYTMWSCQTLPLEALLSCPAAQIYTQICGVFLLAPTNMLHVSIGAHRQVIFVPSSTNLDKNMLKLSIGWSSSTDLHENLYRLFACRANALCRK